MAKKKEMNRTAGTARRKMSASERVSYGLKTGAPLTGSASGVKSISLREAGEALTQGIVSARGKKLSFDPAGLAFALPVGKLTKAASALRAAGNAGNRLKFAAAEALEARVFAKAAGGSKKGIAAINSIPGLSMEGVSIGRGLAKDARKASERVFPRAAGAVGESSREITARLGRQSNLPMARKRELSEAVKQTGTGFTKFSKGKAPKATRETSAARNKRLNKAYDLPGFDFNPIFKKTRGR